MKLYNYEMYSLYQKYILLSENLFYDFIRLFIYFFLNLFSINVLNLISIKCIERIIT
jgi:hypothetical protein